MIMASTRAGSKTPRIHTTLKPPSRMEMGMGTEMGTKRNNYLANWRKIQP
jgi:hypothetical protein